MTNIQLTDEQVVLLQDILDVVDLEDVLEEGFSDEYYDHCIDVVREILRKVQ